MTIGFRQRMKCRTRGRLRRMAGRSCPYCGVEMIRGGPIHVRPTRDHHVPLSRGGLDMLENILVICWQCNQDKGSLLAEEFVAWREGRASRLDKGIKGDFKP